MKILILHRWLVIGGTEKILENLLKLLHGRKVECKLLINYKLPEYNYAQKKFTNSFDCEFVQEYDEYQRRKIFFQRERKSIFVKLQCELFKHKQKKLFNNKLSEVLQRESFDLIVDFSGSLDNAIRSIFISKRIKIPVIRWMHEQLNGNVELTQKQKEKHSQIFSKYSAVISICEQMTERLRSTFSTLPPKLFYTLYNPIDILEIKRLSTCDLEYNLHLPYILQVSRLAKGKGHEELLEIYALLKQRGLQHKLYFIGDGENRQNLEKLITELGLEQDCFLLGTIENPYPYFKNADLFVHTSEHEGLPTVLLESMACGTPVVSMDCPTGPRDILGQNNEYGILIPMHDKTAFCEAVYNLLHNRDMYEYYSLQSKKRIKDFSIENTAPKLEQLFKDIAQLNHGLPKP